MPTKSKEKLSNKDLLDIINSSKEELKSTDAWKDLCEEYDQDINVIDLIPIMFDDLDVSATTDHGIITLNIKLLKDDDLPKLNFGYLIHEISHVFQQTCNEKPTQTIENQEYLDNPDEIEAFQNQVQFIGEELSEDKAEDYVENLLDYHEIEDENKEEELLSKL